MNVLAAVVFSLVLGAAACGPRASAVAPRNLPVGPAASCTILRRGGDTPDGPAYTYMDPVAVEYRYDARGCLLYAVDQPAYDAIRTSWFTYDAGLRIVRIHREIDRFRLRGMIAFSNCDEEPCLLTPWNDRDASDEVERYDEQGRFIGSVERLTRYDHQGGEWRDVPAPASRSDSGSICDIDPPACSKQRLVGGTFRALSITTRTVELRYGGAATADGAWQALPRPSVDPGYRTIPGYDRVGRLTSLRSTRLSDGDAVTSTYVYSAGCTGVHRVPEDPRGMTVSIDPLAHVLR